MNILIIIDQVSGESRVRSKNTDGQIRCWRVLKARHGRGWVCMFAESRDLQHISQEHLTRVKRLEGRDGHSGEHLGESYTLGLAERSFAHKIRVIWSVWIIRCDGQLELYVIASAESAGRSDPAGKPMSNTFFSSLYRDRWPCELRELNSWFSSYKERKNLNIRKRTTHDWDPAYRTWLSEIHLLQNVTQTGLNGSITTSAFTSEPFGSCSGVVLFIFTYLKSFCWTTI